MKITLDRIAKDLGTTKNTVSRALRGKPGVSDELRDKIVALASKYEYKKKKSVDQTPLKITMVCNNAMQTDIFFWPTVMSGIFEYSAQHQISINSVIVDMLKDDIKGIMPLQEKNCDGILIVGTIPEPQFARIAELSLPMVAADHYSDFVECDYVNAANENGIIKAVDFLFKKGHRKIGFVNNETAPYIHSLTKRYQGYVRRMNELRLTIDPRFVLQNSSYADPKYFAQQLNKLNGDAPTAWICANDLTAYNFSSVLVERGVRIPQDVSIVGFDNIPSVFPIQLTTLDIPPRKMGQHALARLVRRINHPEEPFESIELLTRLVDKNSVQEI